ncbi:MAG: ferritin-like domain-containing protein [Actinomycetota bacterium]
MHRRTFLKGTAAVIPGTMALDMLLNRSFAFAQTPDFATDIDVLNYALTLEYLESAFYTQGNAKNLLTGVEATYLKAIGADEAAHVAALKATITKLGGTPVAAPGVDFKDSFSTRDKFLMTSNTLENVGVGAYLGAAGFIKNKDILQAAAGIFGVEARHAAVTGNLLNLPPEGGVYKGAAESPMTKAAVLAAAGPFLTGK